MSNRIQTAVALFLVSFLTSYAKAEQGCPPLRLDGPGGSMEHVEVRDENDLDICFGDTASAFTDAWRFTHGDTNYGFQTSGLISAIETLQRNKNFGPLFSEEVPDVLNEIGLLGSCDQRVVIEDLGPTITTEIVSKLEEFQYAGWQDLHRKNGHALYMKYYDAQIVPWLKSLQESGGSLQEVLPLSDLPTILAKSDPGTELLEILGPGCKEKNVISPQMPEFSNVDISERSIQEVSNLIDSHLTSIHSLPVAITYCGGVILYGKGFRAIDRNTGDSDDKTCNPHASLVIGRQKDPVSGKCQYLVRDDSGTDCKHNQVYNQWKCENGGIWIDTDDLSASVFDIVVASGSH